MMRRREKQIVKAFNLDSKIKVIQKYQKVL